MVRGVHSGGADVTARTRIAPGSRPTHPNTVPSIERRQRSVGNTPLWILPARLLLFAGFQGLLALLFATTGDREPIVSAAAWWPIGAVVANGVNIALLAYVAGREGVRLRDLYNLRRSSWRRILVPFVVVLALTLPVGYLPNLGLGVLLFGDPSQPVDMFLEPLPRWAAVAGVILFPITIAFAELPTYFGYVMPRLEARWQRPVLALAAPAIFLALQHAALPFLPDWRFVAWRALMFLPFAFLVAIAIRWRPGMLPYLMAAHALIDLVAAAPLLGEAQP